MNEDQLNKSHYISPSNRVVMQGGGAQLQAWESGAAGLTQDRRGSQTRSGQDTHPGVLLLAGCPAQVGCPFSGMHHFYNLGDGGGDSAIPMGGMK